MTGRVPGRTKRIAVQSKIIGIVGGLGPHAHIDFERKLLAAAEELVGASADQDYPEWVLSSMPQTPDRTLAIEGKAPDPVPWLSRGLSRVSLSSADSPGADFAVIPCNTAHYFFDRLCDESPIPILHMIDETAQHISAMYSVEVVGLLATTGTLASRLYHTWLEKAGIRVVSPLDLSEGERLQRELVMEPIYGAFRDGEYRGGGIKSGGRSVASTRLLEEGAARLIEDLDAELVIAGCTEIPLALSGEEVGGVPLVDPTWVLARAAVREAYGLEKV